jgi:hypothetical protein
LTRGFSKELIHLTCEEAGNNTVIYIYIHKKVKLPPCTGKGNCVVADCLGAWAPSHHCWSIPSHCHCALIAIFMPWGYKTKKHSQLIKTRKRVKKEKHSPVAQTTINDILGPRFVQYGLLVAAFGRRKRTS